MIGRTDVLIVLDRALSEYEMSRILAGDGVEVHEATSLVAIGENRDGVRRVRLASRAGEREIDAAMVFAADGISSRTARLVGLSPSLKVEWSRAESRSGDPIASGAASA